MNFSSQKNLAENPTSATGEIKKTFDKRYREKRTEKNRQKWRYRNYVKLKAAAEAGLCPVEAPGLKVDFSQARQQIACLLYVCHIIS